MKKNIKLIAILLSTAILAVGCGKSSDKEGSATTNENATTSESTTTTENVDYSQYVTLGTYKGVSYTKQTIEVTDQEVEDQIQSTLQNNAVNTEITDRDTVAQGDIANIDFEGLLDGVAFEGGTAQAQNLTIGSGQFIEGFEEQLIGAKVGESVSINVTFPEVYDNNPDLAGKPVVFNVKINSINTETVPELTDEFVSGISESKTVDEYRQSVREDITKSKEDDAEYQKQSEIWKAVKDACEVKEYPQELVGKYTEQANKDYASYAEQAGVSIDELMTTYFGMSMEDYAKEIVAQEMIIKAIAKDAGIEVTDEQFKAKTAEIATTYGYESADALIEKFGEAELKDSFLYEAVMDYLSENAVEA